MKPLLRHQNDALAFLRRRGWRGALFMEPGLGKTRVGLEAARRARRTIVMAPLNPAMFVWPAQRQEWARDLSFALVRGSPKERARILFDQKPDIAVLNYDLVHWLYDEVAARRKLPYDLLILDESTAVKSSSSVAFRALQALEPAFDAVIPMTGTPAENSLHDLWGQLWFVDRGEALGKRIGVFRERYCSPVVKENYATWKVTRAQDLRRDAAPLCFVRRATDCLDMPPLIFNDVVFDLTSAERRFYETTRKHYIVELPDEPFTLANAGVALDKLRQITSGFVYDEERVAHVIERVPSKIRALEEAVDEAFGRPILVGFWYQGSKRLIQAAFPNAPAIDRFTPPREKERLFAAWSRGELPILLGQVKTIALGMNMQSPDASVIFYDMPWSHGQHWQFIRRIWRQGQATKVVVRRLIARYTVDGYVASVLKRKQQAEDELLTTILEEELI